MAEIDGITTRAAEEDRPLSDAERASCERKREAITELDADIAVEVQAGESRAHYEELMARVDTTPVTTTQAVSRAAPDDVDFASPGEYLSTFFAARKDHDTAAANRLERYRQQRANQTTAENPGLLPTPIIAPLLQTVDARRPAIDAATRRPLPNGAGKSFTRPIVSGHTSVGLQAAEKTALLSSPMTVDEITVTRTTHGGAVNLSWQDRDWTDPAVLNVLLSDLSAGYAASTDRAFCAELESRVTQTVYATTGATPAVSDPTSWIRAIYEAAAIVFNAGNATPNTMWVSSSVWAQLGSLVDGAGRPLFPTVAPSNALGGINPTSTDGSVAGFRLVVDGNLSDGTAILGDALNAEFYEQVGGMVSALEPNILGTSVAFYGYAASVITRPSTFVKIISA